MKQKTVEKYFMWIILLTAIAKEKKLYYFIMLVQKNSIEREHNKKTKDHEDYFVSKLTLKIQSGELGVQVSKHKNKNFIECFSYLTQKRENTDKNYSIWRSALKTFKRILSRRLKF